jgi:Zn-dependent membrane protease YugP
MIGFGGWGLYLLFSLPALILGLWAQWKVKSTFSRNSQIRTMRGWTGAQVARAVLDGNGLYDVAVERVQGFLSDHYDPSKRILRLSLEVYDSPSLSAAGVAAHEAGHAIQHKLAYSPLQLRSAMVPTVQIGSWIGPIIFMIGFFMQGVLGSTLAWVGVGLFAAIAIFALVTLPVEFDASRRAKQQLVASGVIIGNEMRGVNAVLDAAALTYVAGAVQAISTLLYYVFLLTGRQED